jgi:hypothetical protein
MSLLQSDTPAACSNSSTLRLPSITLPVLAGPEQGKPIFRLYKAVPNQTAKLGPDESTEINCDSSHRQSAKTTLDQEGKGA